MMERSFALKVENLDAFLPEIGLPLGILILGSMFARRLAGGPGGWTVARAYIRRTLITIKSYRFRIVASFFQLALTLLAVIYIGEPIIRRLLGPLSFAMEDVSEVNYLVFILIGSAVWPILLKGMTTTSSKIRREQWTGMLEVVVPTEYGVRVLPFAHLVNKVIPSMLSFFTTLGILWVLLPEGSTAIGELLPMLDLLAVILLGVLMMWGIGLVIGGLTAIYKETGPVTSMIRFVFIILSGIYIPVEVLPAGLRWISPWLPLTPVFHVARGIIANGTPMAAYPYEVAMMVAYAVTFVALGVVVYNRLINKARRMGAMGGY